MTAKAGWYPDPQMAGTRRYWDGSAWTQDVAPEDSKSPGFWTLTRAVTLGILAAVAAVVFVYTLAHSNDELKCETENAQRVREGLPALPC